MNGPLGRRREGRGQTLVEFALILPVFILVLVGIFDLGRAIYAYNTVSNAAREAVRLGIVDQNVSAIETEAIQHSVALSVSGADVDVTFRQPGGGAGICVTPVAIDCEVEVVVRYQYFAATPLIGHIVGVINISSTAREPVEYSYESP